MKEKKLAFPEAQRIWAFALDKYNYTGNVSDYYVTLRGPFFTDDNRKVFRAKTTGTRYLVISDQYPLERFVEYGMRNLEFNNHNIARLGISSYAAQDRVDGRQNYKEINFIYLIKSVNIIDTENIALSAIVRARGESEPDIIDVRRTKDFPKSQLKEQLKTFIVHLCKERMDRVAPLVWNDNQ